MSENNTMTQEQLIAELEALRRENANLKSKGAGLKISEKGAVSCYGLGRFPITLYANQWEKLAEKLPEIKAFIAANKDKLSVKPEGNSETQEQVRTAS